jgi:hypothetical protein
MFTIIATIPGYTRKHYFLFDKLAWVFKDYAIFSEIGVHSTQADEKNKFEQQIQKLNHQIKKPEEKSSSELRRISALYEENMTAIELKSYPDLEKELGDYGISIHDDFSKFVKVVHRISQKCKSNLTELMRNKTINKNTIHEWWN